MTRHHVDATALRKHASRGAIASIAGQAFNFVLRILSMVVLARLITPEHFGLIAMAMTFVGFLSLIRDAGLSTATVQSTTVSNELLSTLFWASLLIGVSLALITICAAPLLVSLFDDSRLLWISISLSAVFVANAAQGQFRALVQRRMKFGVLTIIDCFSVTAGVIVGIAMAIAGFEYWSLVGMTIVQPMVAAVAMWLACGWMPGMPRVAEGLREKLNFGGTLTLNGLVIYVGYNLDKVLVGRLLGSEQLGIYSRAYQVITIPTDNLNTTLGWVMFPVLAKVKDDPERLRRYVMILMTAHLSIVLPIIIACGVFAEDFILVLLGPRWYAAAEVFRALSPAMFVMAILGPLGQLIIATGRAAQSLKLAMLMTPVLIAGYGLGLYGGVHGVALGFSTSMLLIAMPAVWIAIRGTSVRFVDIVRTAGAPSITAIAGSGLAWVAAAGMESWSPVLRLAAEVSILLGATYLLLLLMPEQRHTLRDVLGAIRSRPVQ